MFKEYKPSEKCYISDLLQINKIIAAAPCGTERDINQQENDLYKTISAVYYLVCGVWIGVPHLKCFTRRDSRLSGRRHTTHATPHTSGKWVN